MALAVACLFAPASAGAIDLPLPTPAPVALPATTALCAVPVSVSGIFDQTVAATKQTGQHWAVAGDTVEVDGGGFLQAGCTVTVRIGDAPAITLVNIAPAGHSLSFTAPSFGGALNNTKGINGPVSVQLTDTLGNVAGSNTNYHFLELPAAALSQSQPREGDSETVTGYGLNSGGDPLALSGSYTGCPASPGAISMAAYVASDTQLSVPVPPAYCDGLVSINVLSPHYDSAAGASDDAPISTSVPAGWIDVRPVVTGVSPTTVSPGGYIDVQGSGFGPYGSARVNGVGAGAAWSDSEVIVQAPNTTSGQLVLTRTTGDHASFVAANITMAQQSSTGTGGSSSGGSSGNSSSSSSSGSPGTSSSSSGGQGTSGPGVTPAFPVPGFNISGGFSGSPAAFTLPYGAVPPAKSGAPRELLSAEQAQNSLTISTASTEGQVGSDLAVVVTLVELGKPVASAPVSLSLVSAPGSDAAVKPSTGVTDDKGQFHGKLHLSRLAGDHLVLGRSGVYSDEVHVLAQAAVVGSSIKLPFGNINITGNPLVVWLSVACFALILLGIIVNLNVMRRFLWSVTGGKLIHLRLGRKRPRVTPA